MKWPVVSVLVALLVLPVQAFSFGVQELYETWRNQYLVPDEPGVILDVPYVVTEDHIADQMFKLLKLKPGDIFYDLGCGDGRLVIGAVKHPGVRGVGIDLDPRRVEESKANARAAGVSDRTTFIRQDIFQSDFRDATAIAIYLLPSLNLKLRPRFFQELKPGTRIVSHNFDMGEWKPDQTVYAGLWLDGFHYLHYWVIPANASGMWQGTKGGRMWSLSFTQRFQKAEGTLSVDGGPAIPLSRPTITGEMIRFGVPGGNPRDPVTFEGRINGDVMEGAIIEAGGVRSPFRVTRDPRTMSSVD